MAANNKAFWICVYLVLVNFISCASTIIDKINFVYNDFLANNSVCGQFEFQRHGLQWEKVATLWGLVVDKKTVQGTEVV